MSMQKKLAAIPNLGDYYYPVKVLIESCLDNITLIKCPPTTKKTVELGAKNSPDTVCTPYKITLGNFIDVLEKTDAKVLIMPGVACRLGLFDVLQAQALKDLGYDCEMIVLFDFIANSARLFRALNKYNPKLSEEYYKKVMQIVQKIVLDMDEFADYIRRNAAFCGCKSELEKIYSEYLEKASTATDFEFVVNLGQAYRQRMHSLRLDKPKNPIRIGLIGDLYSVMEPHGNCNIERWLIESGVEIIRPFDLTLAAKVLTEASGLNELVSKSGGYIDYHLGGVANCTIAIANELACEGVDGLIHMKAASCSPEITAMSILQNISKDKNVPIIYFTFDTETSEAGLHTRLEAFLDMLVMKREAS